jgi:hypothetical protein
VGITTEYVQRMSTQVKWDYHLSENIYINQGIQQGENSQHLYINATTMQYWTA